MIRVLKKGIIALVVAVIGVAISSGAELSPVHAVGLTAYIYNTNIASNTGLSFCAPSTTKGCIDSLTIDGQQVTAAVSMAGANYIIAGGLYAPYCRFVETEAVPCEVPYMVIYPTGNQVSTALPMSDVTVNFRRAQNDSPTTRIGTAIVNGKLQSFVPAAPGLRDIATVSAKTTTIQQAYQSTQPWCSGWVIAIDQCSVPQNATSMRTNLVNILLLPGMRSSIVPPDKLDPSCVPSMTNGCVIPVFEANSFGGWAETDAFIFGMSSADRDTGASQMQVAGPHFKYPEDGVSDALNLSYYNVFMPSAFLMTSFGLQPSEANEMSLPVRRTLGTTSTTPATTYTATSDGVQISTSGIGFSAPTVTMQRILQVKKNKKVTAETLLRAAGVFHSKQFGSPKILANKASGFTKVGKRFVFKKAKVVKVAIKYKSTASDTTYRILTVKVTRK